MKIIIKIKNLESDRSLEQFISEKINSLEKFFGNLMNEENYYGKFFGKGKPKLEARVEVEKITSHHQKGKIFKAECQIRLLGKTLRSEAVSEDLKIAVNMVKDELQRELKKYKEKLVEENRRKQRLLESI